jgi:TRAP transporter TAXI family solute receptor
MRMAASRSEPSPTAARPSRRAVLAFAIGALVCAGQVWAAAPGAAQQSRYFRIGTANTTGTYFQVGGVLASAISAPAALPNCQPGGSCGVSGLIAIAQATQGSVENVQLLGRGQLDSALVQADIASWAFHATSIYANNPVRGLRAIAALFPENLHVIVRREGPIQSLRDLKGRRVGLGEKESGTLIDARLLLEAASLKERDLKAEYLGLGEAAAGLRGGTLDAFVLIGGTPLPAIADLASTTAIRLLPVSGEIAQRLTIRDPLFAAATVPEGAYPGVDEATPTVALNAVWVVTAEAPDLLVYQITKSLWNEATQRVIALRQPMARRMSLAHALDGVDIPLHPGAERFYREAGVPAIGR